MKLIYYLLTEMFISGGVMKVTFFSLDHCHINYEKREIAIGLVTKHKIYIK